MNVNYKSNFAIILTFEGGLPQTKWRMRFRTRSNSATTPMSGGYTVGYDGKYYTRSRPNPDAEGEIIVELRDHGLTPGDLFFEWSELVINEIFEDGFQRVVRPTMIPITLVEDAGDEAITGSSIESAYIKII